MKKITAIAAITLLIPTLSHAEDYDFTATPDATTRAVGSGTKSFTLTNRTDENVFVRIGYTVPESLCSHTSFRLAPGQTAKVSKEPGCVPYLLSGFIGVKGYNREAEHERKIDTPYARTMSDPGDHLWYVDYKNKDNKM